MEFTGGKKYGLHLRVPVGSQSKKPVRKPADLSSVFGADDEDTREDELARQASKKRSLREVGEAFFTTGTSCMFFVQRVVSWTRNWEWELDGASDGCCQLG